MCYKAIDLFAGCGGLSQGLSMADFKVIAAVEIGDAQAKTYKENHQQTNVIQKDIRIVSKDILELQLNKSNLEIDLLAGCPPCQGFSTLRTLNGKKSNSDPRNDLLFEFLRLVEELNPTSIFLENVPALKEDPRFDYFTKRLKEIGYLGNVQIVNANDYSVPQFRKRLVYIAGKGFFIPFPEKKDEKKNVYSAIGDFPLPGESGDLLHDWPEKRSSRVKEIINNIPKDGGSRSALPVEMQLKCHKSFSGFTDVYGRMKWSSPSPTITSGCINPSKGRFIHPERNSAITLREAAVLQGFPINYKFISKRKEEIALMIGNAFPPPVAYEIGKIILKRLCEV